MRVREAGTRTLGSAAWAVTLEISGRERAPVPGGAASRWPSAGGAMEQLRPEPRPRAWTAPGQAVPTGPAQQDRPASTSISRTVSTAAQAVPLTRGPLHTLSWAGSGVQADGETVRQAPIGVQGCRLRGSEPGEGLWGASVFRRRQRRGRPAAGERSRGGALSRPPSLTAWLAPRLTFSAANSAGHGPRVRGAPRLVAPGSRGAPRSPRCAHTRSALDTPAPPPQAQTWEGTRPAQSACSSSSALRPPALPGCLSVPLPVSPPRSLCLSLLPELGGKRK